MDLENSVDLVPDPAEERGRVKRSYGVAATAVVIQLLAAEAAAAVLFLLWTAVFVPRATERTVPLLNILSLGVSALAEIAAVLFGCKRLRAFTVRDFLSTRFRSRAVPAGIFGVMAISPAALFLVTILVAATGNTGGAERLAETLAFGDSALFNVLIVAYTCVIGPVLEELLFRGVVMNALSPVSRKFAVVASAALFAMIHGNFTQMPNAFLAGLFLGYMAFKSGSVVPGILGHMVMNICALALGAVISAYGGAGALIFLQTEFGAGLLCMIIYIRKNGRKLGDADLILPRYRSFLPAKSENTVRLLFTRPSFWIAVIWCLGSAVLLWTGGAA